MDPYNERLFDANNFWLLQSHGMSGFHIPCRGSQQPTTLAPNNNNYGISTSNEMPLLIQPPFPPNLVYGTPHPNPPSPYSSVYSDSNRSLSPQAPPSPPKHISPAPSPIASTSSTIPPTTSSSAPSRHISSSSSRKRRRAQEDNPSSSSEAIDNSELPLLPPNATEEERCVWLRQRNTIQARRNRKRRMLRFQQLEEDVEELNLSREMWRARACTLKEILAGHGLPCPDWS